MPSLTTYTGVRTSMLLGCTWGGASRHRRTFWKGREWRVWIRIAPCANLLRATCGHSLRRGWPGVVQRKSPATRCSNQNRLEFGAEVRRCGEPR